MKFVLDKARERLSEDENEELMQVLVQGDPTKRVT